MSSSKIIDKKLEININNSKVIDDSSEQIRFNRLLNQLTQLEEAKRKKLNEYDLRIQEVKQQLRDFDIYEKANKNTGYSWKNSKLDITNIRVNRFMLFKYLFMRINFMGTIKEIELSFEFDNLPKALIIGVVANSRIKLTHIWIKSNKLKDYVKGDEIQFSARVCYYFKQKDFLSFGVEDVRNIRKITTENRKLYQRKWNFL
jgi:hypothetical protein